MIGVDNAFIRVYASCKECEMNKKDPLYKTIYRTIVEKIENGEYKSGDQIPTEAEWADIYNVSRITSKKALDLAAENGIIVKQPGKGSFVTEEAIKICREKDRSREKILAIVQHDLSDFFGLDFYLHLEKVAEEAGFLLLTGISNKSVEKEKKLIAKFHNYGVDGFIIFPVHNERFNNEILKLILEKFPVILIDRYLHDVACPNVVSKNLEAAYNGMNYLYELGHKNIAIVSRPIENTSTLQERERGVRKAIMEKGFQSKPQWWLTHLKGLDNKEERSFHEHKEMVKTFLKENSDITAIFTLEYSPIPIIEVVAKELGLRIPEDLSVMSFDSPGHLVNHIQPLTHMRQNEKKIAEKALSLMSDMLDGKKPESYRHEVDVELMEGETTRVLS